MFEKMKIFLMIAVLFAVSFAYAEDPVIDEGPLSVNSFCLLEEGGSVYGGINSEFIYSEGETGCLPFTEKLADFIDLNETVYSIAGVNNKILAVGFYNRFALYNVSHPINPVMLYEKTIYGPASDLIFNENVLYIATENGVSSFDLDTGDFNHKYTYGTTKALRIYDDKLYVGDGQGIKILNLDTLEIEDQRNTSGDVTKLEIMDGVIYTFEWAGLKRYEAETLAPISTCCYNPYEPELKAYDGTLYSHGNNEFQKIAFNGSSVVTTAMIGDRVELRNNYTVDDITMFPEGSGIRLSYMKTQYPTHEPEDLTDEMVVLGEQVDSPYSVENLTAARNSLIDKGEIEEGEISDEDLAPTHYYIEFKPDNEEEMKLIHAGGFPVSDIPLDHEIAQGGSVYINPDVPEDKPAYQYAVVGVDTSLPDIDYEILEEVILEPAEGEPTPDFFLNYYPLLEEESFLILDLEIIASWKPSGKITVEDPFLNSSPPVAGVPILIHDTFLKMTETVITDANGEFESDRNYSSAVHYSIVWRAPQREFYIEAGNSGEQAFYTTTTGTAEIKPFKFHIVEVFAGRHWFYAHLFRGANYFFTMMDILSHFNNGLSYSTITDSIKIEAHYGGDSSRDFGRAFCQDFDSPTIPHISMPRNVRNEATDPVIPRSSRNLFRLTMHELAHIDHCYLIRGEKCNLKDPNDFSIEDIRWGDINKMITEGYAMLIEEFFGNWEYGDSGFLQLRSLEEFFRVPVPATNTPGGSGVYGPVAIDMVDRYNQRVQNGAHPSGETYPVDEVEGYTIWQVRNSIKDVTDFLNGWKQSLRNKYPNNPTDGDELDSLFPQYIFIPPGVVEPIVPPQF
ncbi:MAG: hypothetical protein R6W70_00970 [bacterium]